MWKGKEKMRLEKVQETLTEKKIEFDYVEEDGLGSIDFQYRGLAYHVWEFADEDGVPCGAETNLFHAGRSEDIEGDYKQVIIDELNRDFN